MSNNQIKIGITHGDYNGVGYEVMIKALQHRQTLELFTPIIYGIREVWIEYERILGVKPSAIEVIPHPSKAAVGKLNFIELPSKRGVQLCPGEPSPSSGLMAAQALQLAREHIMEQAIDSVVTAPICKECIQSDIFRFNGHTEFFAEPFEEQPTMIFVAGHLKVALVTMHTPLADVPQHLSLASLTKSILGLEQTLKQDFGILQPRIALLGLNPHAGEKGLLGKEEEEVILPAVQQAWNSGRHVFGPFPADGFWGSGAYRNYDATLALYHDQGLTPFKMLAMEEGVNVTAGLPIIRTSPDHGTAFDIAGKGVANEASLRNAIYMAIDIYRHRKRYKENTRNPLQKKYVERGKDNVRLDLSKSVDEE